MTTDVSIDLETLGMGEEALILEIGAVKFDRHTGEVKEMFHALIEPQEGTGTIDLPTALWWLRQPEAARERLFSVELANERVPLAQALISFSEWLGLAEDAEGKPVIDSNLELWQRGYLDSVWLTSAYKGLGLTAPFHYRQWSDQRTMTKLLVGDWPERKGVHHTALADAVYQAECLTRVFQQLAAR